MEQALTLLNFSVVVILNPNALIHKIKCLDSEAI